MVRFEVIAACGLTRLGWEFLLSASVFVFSWLSCSFQHTVLAWEGVSRSAELRFAVRKANAGTYRLHPRLLFYRIPSDSCFPIDFVRFQFGVL